MSDTNGDMHVLALEAERETLRARIAELEACNVADIDPARVAALVAERDRLALEVAVLRGAMPDAGLLDSAANVARTMWRTDLQDAFSAAAAAIRALATATPTPPAAEAVTGGGGWTREAPDGWTLWGERWLVIHGNMTPSKCDVFPRDGVPRVLWGSGEYGVEIVKLWGPRVEPPDGWEAALRRAIDTAIALDQPQEASS